MATEDINNMQIVWGVFRFSDGACTHISEQKHWEYCSPNVTIEQVYGLEVSRYAEDGKRNASWAHSVLARPHEYYARVLDVIPASRCDAMR